MSAGIAVLSLACRFPEADGPEALWRNVLDGRRSFRAIPPSRLAMDDYADGRCAPADGIPDIMAGLIADWQVARDRLRIPKSSFDAADLTHWLALETALDAVDAIGGPSVLPRDATAVILGNTLTGEFSRAAQLRLRLPYLQRRLAPVLAEHGLDADTAEAVARAFGTAVAGDFPEPNEDSLAGALANTIAGRIANHLDLHGGAWTVDGACASSLLSIADGCARIAEGSAEVAIVGGVDLSLDPFELVGFARTGALARDEMRVFDRRSAGFWPGEGCGVAVLASEAAAARLDGTPLAWIAGWGRSTDGAGGLTRPTAAGQARAIRKAWHHAGRAPDQAGLFEAHGTGTAVGDITEITALADAIGADGAGLPVGGIKANIGHCKAAAGIAGFIKATLAVRDGIVPPHVGCDEPHPVFAETGNRLRPAQADTFGPGPRHAGVSAFGFGGVNAHVVIAADGGRARSVPAPPPPRPQSAELFVFAEATREALRDALAAMAARAPSLSLSEMTDAAAECAATADPAAPWRAAVAAARPAALAAALEREIAALDDARPVAAPPAIGFLFPGQAAPVRAGGGAWARRFPDLADGFAAAPADGDPATETAQPAIVAASLAGLDVLARAGIDATAALGHSLGEYAALTWAGAIDRPTTLRLVAERGRLMARHGVAGGGMLRVAADPAAVAATDPPGVLEIACLNGPADTVLAGPAAATDRWRTTAAAHGLAAEPLAVSHAFHSAAMAPAGGPLARVLEGIAWKAPSRRVLSSVTAAPIDGADGLPDLLTRQLTAPVRFWEAVSSLAATCDLLIEVGPGRGLTRLAAPTGVTTASLDVGAADLGGLLATLATAWRAGARLDLAWLFADRATRPLGAPPQLLANPCGLDPARASPRPPAAAPADPSPPTPAPIAADSALEAVRVATAEALGLPLEVVATEARLLEDLHLNSLSVGRIVHAAAKALGVPPPVAATDLVAETVGGLAALLDELAAFPGADAATVDTIEGVAPWIAEYAVDWQAAIPPASAIGGPLWTCLGGRLDGLPEVEGAPTGAVIPILDPPGDGTAVAHAVWDPVRRARAAGYRHLAIVHRGLPLAGFARSLLNDGAFDTVRLIDLAAAAAAAAAVPLLRTPGDVFEEWRIGPSGMTERAVLRHQALDSDAGGPMLGADDVLLVTGGAKGIGAEAALHLVRDNGAALILLGRSPADDPAVRQTLDRAERQGTRARYLAVDLADAVPLRRALAGLGGTDVPTAFLHAAGVNDPAAFNDLTPADLDRTLAPKVAGLDALLDALDSTRLRLAIGFGSIIGTLGLAGETHYALANGLMSARLEAWGRRTGVPTLALDWSVWAGAGMGERIGAVERLAGLGVEALPLTGALDRLGRLVAGARGSRRLLVAGRFGPPDTVGFADRPVADGRFLAAPRLTFPGVEMVVDTPIAPGADPWLEDHVVDGTPVVPAVLLLEAMAQAARALTGRPVRRLRDVAFPAAVTPGPDGITLRTAVLRRDDGTVAATIRASDDGFRADRATARLAVAPAAADPDAACRVAPTGSAPIAGDKIYEALCFNAGRFRRVAAVTALSAFALRAELGPADPRPWFGAYENPALDLGDPAARDAGLHVLQACVPQRRVLPVAVAAIEIVDPDRPRHTVEAVERRADAEDFVFDIAWRADDGTVVEVWRDARFHAIGARSIEALPYVFLPAALERAAAMVADRRDLRLAIANSDDRPARRAAVLAALDAAAPARRGDGCPLPPDGGALSLSHGEALTLGVRAPDAGPLACDLVDTGVTADAALTPADRRLVETLAAIDPAADAAMVWAARECARKGGLPAGQPLIPLGPASPDMAVFRCGPARILCQRRTGGGCAALLVSPSAADAPEDRP